MPTVGERWDAFGAAIARVDATQMSNAARSG
jgi:hypothetical protein